MNGAADEAEPGSPRDAPAPARHSVEKGALSNHVIIAGYGIPGRSVAEVLQARGVAYCVIELNPSVVERCAKSGTRIIAGDVRDAETLKRAGIGSAQLLAITLPDEKAAIIGTAQARRPNPAVKIITRCAYISAGLEATRSGADDVVVGEQVVAQEFFRLLQERFPF